MNYSFWQMIAGTPWWVFVVFALLLIIGYRATKPHTVPLKKMLLLPVTAIVFSFLGLTAVVKFTPMHLAIWVGTAAVGTLLGWLRLRIMAIKAIKETNSLYFPGTWGTLLFILVIFIIRYYMAYQTAIDPTHATIPHYSDRLLMIYGLFAGFFLGRYLYARRCLKVGPFIAQPPSPAHALARS